MLVKYTNTSGAWLAHPRGAADAERAGPGPVDPGMVHRATPYGPSRIFCFVSFGVSILFLARAPLALAWHTRLRAANMHFAC